MRKGNLSIVLEATGSAFPAENLQAHGMAVIRDEER